MFDVVIPTIGRPELQRALLSVRRQTLPPQNVLVVLDEPDQERAVQGLLTTGESLVVTTGRTGGAAARNMGVLAASSPLVAFLDDDDWWEPRKMEVQVSAIRTTGAAWSCTSTYFHRSNGRVDELPSQKVPQSFRDLPDYLVTRRNPRFGEGMIQSSSLCVSTLLARQILWDATLPRHQDWDWIIRLSERTQSSPMWVEKPLVHVMQGSTNSVSLSRNWEASTSWLQQRRDLFTSRAASDFHWAIAMRSAIRSRDIASVVQCLRQAPRALPHLGASVAVIASLFER